MYITTTKYAVRNRARKLFFRGYSYQTKHVEWSKQARYWDNLEGAEYTVLRLKEDYNIEDVEIVVYKWLEVEVIGGEDVTRA